MKLSELTVENIRNTKVHVKNKHESRAFQGRALELGCSWVVSGAQVYNTGEEWIGVCHNLDMVIFPLNDSDFKELQIDFTNKPTWEDAPNWAKYLAQDLSGRWFWFETAPTINSNCWYFGSTTTCSFASRGVMNYDWRNALEQRPCIDWKEAQKLCSGIGERIQPKNVDVEYASTHKEIKVGDVVCLKSQMKPKMVVEGILPSSIECVWIDDNKVYRETFRRSSLSHVHTLKITEDMYKNGYD